jgi:predicted transcriptional regulator
MIQFFHNGAEYTTRARLEAKYKLPHTTLQAILEDKRLKKIEDGNKFYFLKVQVEQAIEAYVQQQLIAKAAKKKHPQPVLKFESLLRFAEHQAPLLAR